MKLDPARPFFKDNNELIIFRLVERIAAHSMTSQNGACVNGEAYVRFPKLMICISFSKAHCNEEAISHR